MLLVRARLLVATLWAGSLWTIGYVVAPTLFATLADRALAGTIAGSMFRNGALVSFACGLAMLALLAASSRVDAALRRLLMLVVVAMLAAAAANYFWLNPVVSAMREAAGAGGVAAMGADVHQQFRLLHGASMVLYLVQSLLGVVLVLKNPGGRERGTSNGATASK